MVDSVFFSWVLSPLKTMWWLVLWDDANLQKHAFIIGRKGVLRLAEADEDVD